ncbi:hypothetical protein G7Y79_00050g085920 [Physcia stellaris]|nr:hypothetical protein G7Y79_00050g085920 [Physcia stellaris]
MAPLATRELCSCPKHNAAQPEEQQQTYWKKFTSIVPRLPGHGKRRLVTFKPATPFPFMKLPLELRQRVYHFHFQQAKRPGGPGKDCPAGDYCPNAVYNDSVSVRELIKVNKLVYDEAMPVYYRSQVFIFNSCITCRTFLRAIGPFQRSYIAHVSFVWSGYHGTEAFRLLADCPRLRYLEVAVGPYFRKELVHPPHHRRHQWKVMSPMKCSGVKPLLNIRGLLSVKFKSLRATYSTPPLPDVEVFEEALQLLTQPYGNNTKRRGPAREFALSGTPRYDFEDPGSKEKALERALKRALKMDTEDDKIQTVLTKARKELEEGVILTRAKRIKLDMAEELEKSAAGTVRVRRQG